MNTITLICMFLAACSHAMFSLIAHRKFFRGNPFGFFGEKQHYRKYLLIINKECTVLHNAPNNWYHKLFDIPYVERFPFSATALVFITDAYHLLQWLTTKLIFLAITRDPLTYIVIWITWSIGFNIVYSFIPRLWRK